MVEARAPPLQRSATTKNQPRRPNHQHLLTGLDWHTYTQLKHLNTWVQGALQYRDATAAKPCPICPVPATPKHILWLCKWRRTQTHKPLPPELWMERIICPEEEPLWSKGWIPLDTNTSSTPTKGTESGRICQPIGPDQYVGWMGLHLGLSLIHI